MSKRLDKKKYLREIYLDIEAQAFVYMIIGLKANSTISGIREVCKYYKRKLRRTNNPFYKSTRLHEVVEQALVVAKVA